MDWALLNDDRFAGMYLTASLLGVFSAALLGMSGSEIRLWMQKVRTHRDRILYHPVSSRIYPQSVNLMLLVKGCSRY